MEKLIGPKELGRLLGKSTERIRQLAEEGIIPFTREKTARRYDPYEAIPAFVAYQDERIENKATQEVVDKKEEAEARHKAAKAEIEEMKLAELKGEMHSSEDVEYFTSDIVLAIRQSLLAMPGQLAVDIASEISDVKDAPKVSDLIKTTVYAVLEELTEYRYDPDEYQRRVRDRQGWTTDDAQEKGISS